MKSSPMSTRRRVDWSKSSVIPTVGEFPALRLPFKLDGWDDPSVRRPPLLGEHTESVLRERLELSGDRIAELKEAKAI